MKNIQKQKKDRHSTPDIAPLDMQPGTPVWIYLRHSPGDNQTLDSQEAEVMRLVHEKKWVATRIFRDRWASGHSTENRDAFELMVYLARQEPRQADMLIIWEFGRFARNQDDAQFYTAEFRLHGWKILSMKDEIPSGGFGRIFEALIHWKNDQFLIDLRANTKRGLRYIAEKGCVPVGSICKGYVAIEEPIGICKDGTPRLGRKPIVAPEVAPLIIRAFEMKANGASHDLIFQKTKLYDSKSGSWDYFFRSRIYVGEYEFLGEVFTNIYPPIISKELFDAVQKRIPKRQVYRLANTHHPRRKGSLFFLANISSCAYCGMPMEGKRVKQYRYYICKQHNENADLCPNASLIPANGIEEAVLQTLLNHVFKPTQMHDLLEWTNKRLNSGLEELILLIDKTKSDLEEAGLL
jgi:DNA invertase Pin-like site-specific DNA recombinase